jgi:hypothetical protein
VQHSTDGPDFNLERTISMAQRQSAASPKVPVLAQLGSRFNAALLMRGIESCKRTGLAQMN